MSVVPLSDVKAHLEITTSTDDTKIQGFIDSAEAIIAKRVGPLSPTTVTDRVPGATGPLSLRSRPVISLTSVTPSYGSDLDVTRLDVDPLTGLVAYQGYYSSFVSYFPMAWYSVTYQAGYAELPDDIVLAIKEQVRTWWEFSQRGVGRSRGQGQDQAMYTNPNELNPIVAQLIAPYDHLSFA